MIKNYIGKQDGFSVDIYKKKNNRAEVVFRKSRMLLRIRAVLNYDKILCELQAKMVNLDKTTVIELRNAKGRRWVLEIGMDELRSTATVWELMKDGTAVRRFYWQGQIVEPAGAEQQLEYLGELSEV